MMVKPSNGFDRDAFDKSFDFFKGEIGTDPFQATNNGLDNSFESTGFEFTATSGILNLTKNKLESSTLPLFPNDPFAGTAPALLSSPFQSFSTLQPPVERGSGTATVRVALHEQLSALYDDSSSEGTIQIVGTVYVKPVSTKFNKPFCLIFRDLCEHIERMELRKDVCQNITDRARLSKQLLATDRVLLVSLPPVKTLNEEIPIATYVCVPNLRPVPMLVKSRVRSSNDYTRLGLKVRANPSNEYPMNRFTVVVAVPPNVDGGSVTMSRTGGVWDEMKRTLVWTVENVLPGQALEIQAQFASVASRTGREPRFPILVRCEYPILFSSVEVIADVGGAPGQQHVVPVRIIPSSSGLVLHRKV